LKDCLDILVETPTPDLQESSWLLFKTVSSVLFVFCILLLLFRLLFLIIFFVL